MKTKILISIFFAGLSFGFLLLKPSEKINYTAVPPPSTMPGNNDFMIGVLESGAETGYDPLNDLKLNLWSKYTLPDSNMGWVTFHNGGTWVDRRDAPLGNYHGYVNNVMDANANNNMKTMMMRPKLEYLAYGQRSDYQCESESYIADPDYWFYTYNTHPANVSTDYTDNTTYGGGVRVRYSRIANSTNDGPWVHAPGYVVSGLKSNREQCANSVFSSDYQKDARYAWYVKPRIRADKNYVDNHDNEPICRIDVYNFDSVLIKSTDIRARNFKDGSQQYDGYYKEDGFNFDVNRGDSTLIFPQSQGINFNPNGGNWWETNTNSIDYSKMDIRVFWYGVCDMWIDYVRVDNEVANDLFNHVYDNTWLKDEVQTIPSGRENDVFRYYIEEFEFNNRPCMKYVNDKIKALSNNQFSLMCDVYWGGYNLHKPNVWQRPFTKEEFKRTLVDYVGLKQIYMGSFPMMGYYDNGDPNFFFNHKVYIPSTLPIAHDYDPQNGFFCKTKTPADYDTWLQGWLDDPSYDFGQAGEDRFYNEMANYISNASNIPWYTIVQTHLWYTSSNIYREPTNEEQDLLVNLPVSYGSKGILYFWYSSWGKIPSNLTDGFGRGLTNPINPAPQDVVFLQPGVQYEKRTANIYGQDKWNKVKDINTRLAAWGKYLMSFDNAQTRSYIYRFDRANFLSSTYFNDIKTYPPDNQNMNNPSGSEDPVASTYLQTSVFKDPNEPRSEYFMIVNRRCSPYRPEINENGGRRDIKIQLDANSPTFANFTNYKIKDLGSAQEFGPFINTNPGTIDLGWFMPGEGRLYKIAPVMLDGGTLIADENIYSEPNFTCRGQVDNGGHNITITQPNTINFTGDAHITVTGGTLQIGDIGSSQHEIVITGTGNTSGGYINGVNCSSFRLYNTDFNTDFNYGCFVSDWNCNVTDIQGCNFNCPDNTSAIYAYSVYSQAPRRFTFNISNGNNFYTSSMSNPAIQVLFAGGVQLPAYITNNYFTSSNASSYTTAIQLTNVSGGIVQGNHFTGYSTAINATSCNIPLRSNTVTNSQEASFGLYALSGSVLDMRNVSGYSLGYNSIVNTGSGSHNIDVTNSYFLMYNGNNTFNISSNTGSDHMYGTFPLSDATVDLDISNNCFEQDGNSGSPLNAVTWNGGGPVNFTYNSSSCQIQNPAAGFTVLDLGDNIYDSMRINSGVPLSIYDSLGLEMRKRDYINVIEMSKRILNNSPDSIYSIDAVSKLFAATTYYDTSSTGVTALKDYLANLIINNPDNTNLIRSANYFIQKSKVLLRLYSSALAGFQEIIDQNPYSYEALVAHWDYMATHLLDSISGGAEMGDGDDDRGKSHLTKEQKQFVKQTVLAVFGRSKENEKKTIEKLNDDAVKGDVNAKRVLEQRKNIKETIQQRMPHNIFEHMQIVNDDIKKVFGGKVISSKGKENSIPSVFKLYQNYPNPFNPTATIRYDLPQNVKVNIKIYDLLGRQVKQLVDEFKQAGSYTVNFDGTNLASGVYFYRLEAGKFVDSKKMVLVK